MKKNNRTCIVCSTKYSYCPSCAKDNSNPTWMMIFHNENCKKIFEIASDFLANDISEEHAKKMLEKCDISKVDSFHPSIIKAISKINNNNNNNQYAKKTTIKKTE